MRYYKPIEIARALEISTSALRHYESWGVIPAPKRAENGYRLYTSLHFAYFVCLRHMFPAFGVALTCDVLLDIQKGDRDTAFWRVNKAQADLQYEKIVADQTVQMLQNPELPLVVNKKVKQEMTIGNAAEITGVQLSALRHWEKEGLITPKRNQENGYRIYTPMHIRQILVIRTLRKTVYFLESMKEIVQAVEHHSVEKAQHAAERALVTLHERNRLQMYAVHQLIELWKEVERW